MPINADTSAVDPKIQRRRERGRRSQNAFRKRQAQAKDDLGSENNRLKVALRAIIREVRPDDRPELVARIREAAIILGDLTQPENDRQPDEPLAQENNSSSSATTTAASQMVWELTSNSSSSEIARYDPEQILAIVSTRTSHLNFVPQQETSANLTDPFQRVLGENWLTTMLPYLGNGAFTLSGRLFWRLVAKWEVITRTHLDVQTAPVHLLTASSAPGTSLPWRSVKDLLDYSIRQQKENAVHEQDMKAWRDVISSRLSYGFDNGILAILDPRSRGDEALPQKQNNRWLTPMQVEERIRFVVGNEVFAILARPVLDRWEEKVKKRPEGAHSLLDCDVLGDGNDGVPLLLIDTLLNWVVEQYTCFGDGPRWSLKRLDEGLQEWYRGVTAHALAQDIV
ncbi:hypothetical protein MN608_06507 [Microdochium nivale]|nr:hypothetical protein MN608_06507 [Microdochium nivale]